MQFERSGLFKVIQQNYHCTTVLYPGSSIHITPSFYFPHVVYIDTNEVAQKFFADSDAVLNFVSSHKKYKQSSFVRFINQDFATALTIKENSFDLLIALFAGGISRACKKYLKIGGVLLTNNHHNDASEAARDNEYQLIARLFRKGAAYQICEKEDDGIPPKNPAAKRAYLKRSDSGFIYTDNEDYFLFNKVHLK